MTRETLHTDRLALEPWSDSHAGLLLRLARIPEVVRYIGDGSIWSEARARDVAAAAGEHWDRHGFGWRPAVERATGETVGFTALNFAGEGAGVGAQEYEVGWWLDPVAWGRGLAREGASEICREAFGRLGARSVIARIQPANSASLAVARAIGLVYESRSRGRGGEPIAVLRRSALE